ncbi:amidohydrolase [Alicyclobacillus macrosporangiidus]|uniref:amidohydrolase n=1 Tax=Alicyclobacillus macrosporangiidus TaxID=392015 RepID=UPI00068D0574|nr:amidohydrolase [Alicyclobacillus macrosporangiidus]
MTTLWPEMENLLREVQSDVVAWRRHLHRYPELSYEEHETAQFVHDLLCSFGALEVSRPTPTSVMARLLGAGEGPTVALRADMDALPIEEENTFEFRSSRPGVMHACGHDAHTAILLATAKVLTQLQPWLCGEVRFFFQHAEEVHPGGAVQMVEAGVMDGVDMVLGLHVRSPLEAGVLAISAGPINAASDRFDITIRGRGGHAAHPHTAVDSVLVAAEVVTQLQHLVSRNKDPLEPLVISVTKISGGSAYNVIPETVQLAGTVRTYSPRLREQVPAWMERVIEGVTSAHGATYEFSYRRGYAPLINDPQVAQLVEETLKDAFGPERVRKAQPGMGGEDFSGFLQAAPGAFFHLGVGNREKGIVYPHHHPRFTVDEDALIVGVEAFVRLALRTNGRQPHLAAGERG